MDNNYSDKEKIEKMVKDAKDLLILFEEFKEKAEVNSKSKLFKHLDKMIIAKNIVPYLHIKDIVMFRTACKDVNMAISSTVSLVSYYKATCNKKNNDKGGNVVFKQFNDLNDSDDIQIQLESIKKVF